VERDAYERYQNKRLQFTARLREFCAAENLAWIAFGGRTNQVAKAPITTKGRSVHDVRDDLRSKVADLARGIDRALERA
jgi:predicted heme/steroid binding protein